MQARCCTAAVGELRSRLTREEVDVSEGRLVTVYRSQGILAAEVVRAKLELAGIPVLLRYESAGLILGLTVDGLGLVEVQVPEAMAEDAAALVAGEEDLLEGDAPD